MDLNDYLAAFQLDENPLVGPFFYKTPLALRFEIGPAFEAANLPREEYLERAFRRAVRLLEASKADYDYVMFSQFPHEDRDWDADLADFMERFGFDRPVQVDFPEVMDGVGEFFTWRRHLFPVTNQDLKAILREIVWNDHRNLGGLFYLAASVSFLSSTDQVLYHCYDDRGVDLAMVNRQRLKGMFTFCRDLLFDYDMEEMEKRMADLSKD